jgi:predicted transcriptional regulator
MEYVAQGKQGGRSVNAAQRGSHPRFSAIAKLSGARTSRKGGNRMQVKEIMSTMVEVTGRNDDLSTVEALMATKKLCHVPVLEDGELVGLVSQRDLFKAMMSSTMRS